MTSDDSPHRQCISLNQLPWENVASGLRQKAHLQNDHRIRIVEYGTEFKETEWCTRGHVGYVIDGEMQIDFDGRITTVRRGDAILIAAGEENRHRHHKTVRPTTLFLVEAVDKVGVRQQ